MRAHRGAAAAAEAAKAKQDIAAAKAAAAAEVAKAKAEIEKAREPSTHVRARDAQGNEPAQGNDMHEAARHGDTAALEGLLADYVTKYRQLNEANRDSIEQFLTAMARRDAPAFEVGDGPIALRLTPDEVYTRYVAFCDAQHLSPQCHNKDSFGSKLGQKKLDGVGPSTVNGQGQRGRTGGARRQSAGQD